MSALKRTIQRFTFIALTAGILATAFGGSAQATEVGYGRNFGLGFQLGEPTGIVGKYWVGRTNAIDMGFGFYGYAWGVCGNRNCGGSQSFSLHADYLWQSNLVKSTAQLDWHIGAGGRVVVWNDDHPGQHVAAGARMPVGLDLMFNNPGFLEVFFELVPTVWVSNGMWFAIDGALGVRFYF